MGFDLEDLQPAQSFSRIIGQAIGIVVLAIQMELRLGIMLIRNFLTKGDHTERRGGIVWLKVNNA